MNDNQQKTLVDRQLEEASAHLDNLLGLEQELTGQYPKERLQQLVEEWYRDNKQDVEGTWFTIQNIENTRYRQTCESHLSRLSGLSINHIRKICVPETFWKGTNIQIAPNQKADKQSSYFLFFLGIVAFGTFLCLFYAPQPEGIIIYGLACLALNFFRRM